MAPQLLALIALAATGALAAKDNNRCFGELGCFPVTPEFWHPLRRPFNLAVDPREVIKTKYYFFSRESSTGVTAIPGYMIKDGYELINATTFRNDRPTKVLVHGFIDNLFLARWMMDLKDALLKHGDYNVILADWTGGNGLPYSQASVNTRVVGAEIGVLVEKLQAVYGISASSIHMYGHSLGAHVIGYAGQWLNATVSRLTAMDPAEPLFQGLPAVVRVDASDAQFVEIVHSDAYSFFTRLGFGMTEAVGHVDFFPNGGHWMPGCNINDRVIEVREKDLGLIDAVRKVVGCNHMRAIDYTIDFLEAEADNSQCHPIAFACPSYELFEGGYCSDCGVDGSRCAIMSHDGAEYILKNKGKLSGGTPVKMFFKTSAREPFCLYHYQVIVKMYRDTSNKKVKAVTGTLKIKVNLNNGTSQLFELQHQASGNTFTPGAEYRFLISSPTLLEGIESITFNYRNKRLIFPPKMHLDYIRLTPMTVADKRTNTKKLTKTFCAQNKPIPSRKDTPLTESFCTE